MKKKVIILGAIVALIDQLVKLLAINYLAGNSDICLIKNFFCLTYAENTGAAWGIFSGNRWFLIIMSVLALYAIVKYFLLDGHITKLEFIAYGLLLGGVAGNLIDRLVHGYVVDYANFSFGSYQFPVINLADASIVIGTGLIIFRLLRSTINQRRKK